MSILWAITEAVPPAVLYAPFVLQEHAQTPDFCPVPGETIAKKHQMLFNIYYKFPESEGQGNLRSACFFIIKTELLPFSLTGSCKTLHAARKTIFANAFPPLE